MISICLQIWILCFLRVASQGKRKDVVKKYLYGRGNDQGTRGTSHWGSWGKHQWCSAGKYATAFKLKVEAYVVNKDDTSANSIEIMCRDKNWRNYEWIKPSNPGEWGAWNNGKNSGYVWCPRGEFAKAFRINWQPKQGDHKDDTALNSVQFRCSGGREIEPQNARTWGSGTKDGSYWQPWRECPDGSYICGFNTKVEKNQGGGGGHGDDDTALNNIRVSCCAFDRIKEIKGEWVQVASGQFGSDTTHKIELGVTRETSSSVSKEFSTEVQGMIGATGKILGFELTASVRNSITNTLSRSVSTSKTWTTTKTCPEDTEYMFIWTIKGEEFVSGKKGDFSLTAPIYLCTKTPDPKCGPGLCMDEYCQKCYGEAQQLHHLEVAITKHLYLPGSNQPLNWKPSDAKSVGGRNLFEFNKLYECPDGYVLAGFFKSDCQWIGCIEEMKCVRPDTPGVYQQKCEDVDIREPFDEKGSVQCPDGFFVKGIESWAENKHDNIKKCGLYCWEKLKCCKYEGLNQGNERNYNDWNCFDEGRIKDKWCQVGTNQYITGFNRS